MNIIFRDAHIDDARILFDWRNDRMTRANSHCGDELVYDQHLSWLETTLKNPMRRLLVAEQDDQAVGTVRLDQDIDGSVEISWTVAPQERRRGVASVMVQTAVKDFLESGSVKAEIKIDNIASIKVAEAAGMRLDKEAGGILYFAIG